MKTLLITIAFACSILGLHAAQTTPAVIAPGVTPSGVPDIIADGFKAYLAGGYASATEIWTKGSSLEVDSPTIADINAVFTKTEGTSGPFAGPEVIRIVNLSTSSELVYVFAKYQKSALFFCFTCFKANDKWLVTSIVLDKDPSKVLPTNLLSGGI